MAVQLMVRRQGTTAVFAALLLCAKMLIIGYTVRWLCRHHYSNSHPPLDYSTVNVARSPSYLSMYGAVMGPAKQTPPHSHTHSWAYGHVAGCTLMSCPAQSASKCIAKCFLLPRSLSLCFGVLMYHPFA